MKTLTLSILALFITLISFGQRVGVVDSKYIMSRIPEYKEAQKKIDDFSAAWQREIDQKQSELNKIYKDYDAQKTMLPDNLRQKMEDLMYNKEKELRDLQRRRFGFEGDLFKKRQELVKPIQDRVYNAIQKLAADRSLDLVLDKSEGITVIFADPKLERSEEVLKNLGIK